MRRLVIVMLIGLLVALLSWPVPAVAENDPRMFYDKLSPHGQWIKSGDMGLVWSPDRLPAGWRPFSNGHWVRTDQGPTWVGNEEWSWVTDHYGRWYYGQDVGWVWIPGTQWSPGWVAWREAQGLNGNMVGWSALPPDTDWDFTTGVGTNLAVNDIPYFWWSFTGADNLFLPTLSDSIFAVSDNDRFLRFSRNITRFDFDDGRVFDRSLDRDDLRPFLANAGVFRLGDLDDGTNGFALRNGELAFFRPRIVGRLGDERVIDNLSRERGVLRGQEIGRPEVPDRSVRFREDVQDRGRFIRGGEGVLRITGQGEGFRTDRVIREGGIGTGQANRESGFRTDRVNRSEGFTTDRVNRESGFRTDRVIDRPARVESAPSGGFRGIERGGGGRSFGGFEGGSRGGGGRSEGGRGGGRGIER